MASNYNSSLPVKIGDEGQFVTTTIMGARTLLDVSVANNAVAGSPFVANVAMPTANTEYSYALVPSTKQIMFKTRENSVLKFSFEQGKSGITYITVPPGTSYTLSGVDPSINLTVYFQSPTNNEVLEVISWV